MKNDLTIVTEKLYATGLFSMITLEASGETETLVLLYDIVPMFVGSWLAVQTTLRECVDLLKRSSAALSRSQLLPYYRRDQSCEQHRRECSLGQTIKPVIPAEPGDLSRQSGLALTELLIDMSENPEVLAMSNAHPELFDCLSGIPRDFLEPIQEERGRVAGYGYELIGSSLP